METKNKKIETFRDLIVWQEGHKLVLMTYKLLEGFPKQENYALTDQMRRCAISITSNIAEGFSRQFTKEKLQFFAISRGSLTELENQLIIARDVKYLTIDDFNIINNQLISVHKLLNAFIGKTRIFPNSKFQIPNSSQSGQALFEILLAVAVIVGVVAVFVQLSQMSLQSADVAGDRTVATNFSREAVEAMRAISGENWVSFYNITKGSQYHPEISSGKWVLVAGLENITINGEVYTRYLVVDNVSRNTSTNDIEIIYNSANDDPSTQKVTITIQKSGLADITYSEYISRWKNASPVQTDWTGSSNQADNTTGSGNSVNFDSGYFSNTNICTKSSDVGCSSFLCSLPSEKCIKIQPQ